MIPLADQIVDWATIGKVVAAALIAGLVVISGFSVAILGTARSLELRRIRRGGEATAYAALGLLGVAVCIAAIAGGFVVMTSK
ncbi:MAG TPA: hypothetical protein VFL87_10000 [Thermoleophilaceae bacterium]|nr:hypothetical protein [Thermoleophilaceae bacterium]